MMVEFSRNELSCDVEHVSKQGDPKNILVCLLNMDSLGFGGSPNFEIF